MANGWPSVSVLLGGVEIGPRLVGELTVDAVASAARLCELTYRPAGAAPVSLVGATVAVTLAGTLVFGGRVTTSRRADRCGRVWLRASDRLQEHAAGLTLAAMLAAIPGGRYSADLHGPRRSGWDQLQDVMGTVQGDYDLSAAGVGRWRAWPVYGDAIVAGRTYTDYVEGTLGEPEEPDLSALTNTVLCEVQTRAARAHHHTMACSWRGYAVGEGFCQWRADPWELPTRDLVDSTIRGAGWTVHQVAMEGLPATTATPCGGSIPWILFDDPDRPQSCVYVTWSASRAWSQWVTRTWRWTVSAPASVAAYGQTTDELSAHRADPFDSAAWDGAGSTEPPAGAVALGTGHYAAEQRDEDEDANLLETVMASAARMIAEAHRGWRRTFGVLCDPTLDLGEVATLTCPDVALTGQVVRVLHRLSMDTGRPVTELTVAIPRCVAGAQSGGTLSPPGDPNTTAGVVSPAASVSFPTRVGGRTGVPAYDPDWLGWTTNYTAVIGDLPTEEETYDLAFQVEYPDIDQTAREAVEGVVEVVTDYLVALPHWPLEAGT